MDARVIVCDPESHDLGGRWTQASACAIYTLDSQGQGALIEQSRSRRRISRWWTVGPDIAAILYTSGTTGARRAPMITTAICAANGLALHQFLGWQPGDVLLHALRSTTPRPVSPPLCPAERQPYTVPCRLSMPPPSFDCCPRHSFMGVPTHYTRLLAQPDSTGRPAARCDGFISGRRPC